MLYNPREDQTNRDILAAADIIREGGLSKGRLRTPEGAHCVMGAMLRATEAKDININQARMTARATKALDRVAQHVGLANYTDIPLWNDMPSNTKDNVVEKMCQAAGVSADMLAY